MLLHLWFRTGTMDEYDYSEKDRLMSAALNRDLGKEFEQRARYVSGEPGSTISYFPDDEPVEASIVVVTKMRLVSFRWTKTTRLLEVFEDHAKKEKPGGGHIFVPSAFSRTFGEALAVAQKTGKCPDGTDVLREAIRAMFPNSRPETAETVYEVEKDFDLVAGLTGWQLDPRTWRFLTEKQAKAVLNCGL